MKGKEKRKKDIENKRGEKIVKFAMQKIIPAVLD